MTKETAEQIMLDYASFRKGRPDSRYVDNTPVRIGKDFCHVEITPCMDALYIDLVTNDGIQILRTERGRLSDPDMADLIQHVCRQS